MQLDIKPVTIKDVALEAGVSTTLVSRVMNASRDEHGKLVCSVNKKTVTRILEVVERMGYRPNSAAASLRKKRKNRIGVILPDISHDYFASMARNFENIARENGFTVLFGSSEDDPKRIDDLAKTFIMDNADGIILIVAPDSCEVLENIVRQRVPVVLAVRDIPDVVDVGKVLIDNVKATTLALDHLTGRGFKKIEMLSSPKRISTVVERESLYTEYMKEAGLEYRISHFDLLHQKESISFFIEDAYRRGVDAVYCPSASIPLLCMKVCMDVGLRVPDDMAIMGYDGGDSFNLTAPSITQINFSKEEVASESFRILRDMIDNRSSVPTHVIVGPKLIEGGSTLKSTTKFDFTDDKSKARKELQQALDAIRSLQQLID